MKIPNWGLITSGETFESLVTTLIYFNDPAAALFGRRGKDGGQDARSGDGKKIFQAKHHQNESAASAISDAKSEALKIEKYGHEGHARYEQWKQIKHWHLITNAVFNPTDRLRWDKEVVPLFERLGLTAEYWEQANLNAELVRYPEIQRVYFENETRAFISIPEQKMRFLESEVYLNRKKPTPFHGRDDEIWKIKEFLDSSTAFLLVHGRGGIGKSRLLIEAGDEIAVDGSWQVLWANIESMTTNGSWFDGVATARPTILIVDEPRDDRILRLLSEQLGSKVGLVAKWKVVVTVRSPKDPVLSFLQGARMKRRVADLRLDFLSKEHAADMCMGLFKTGKLSGLPESQLHDASRDISQKFSNHPIWLTLAIHMLELKGDLSEVPTTAADLADSYIKEIEKSQTSYPPEIVASLLRWVALLGPINREDEAAIEVLTLMAETGTLTETLVALKSLVVRQALVQRGARDRYVEIKPDVLRDHILRKWLSRDLGFGRHPIVPSDDAKGLIKYLKSKVAAGEMNQIDQSMLASLARTEFLLRLEGQDLQLMTEFFSEVKETVPLLTARECLTFATMLEGIGAYRPAAAAEVIAALRNSSVPEEKIDGIFPRVIGANDVILSLAWPLFHAAMGAQSIVEQEAVLRELCVLVRQEAEIAPKLKHGLPNDGKRASALLKRVLEGGPQFWSEFDIVAGKLALEIIESLAKHPPTDADSALVKALVHPVTSLARSQTWTDGRAIKFRTFAIGPQHAGWEPRRKAMSRIKEALESNGTPAESRIVLWEAYSEAYMGMNETYRREAKGVRYSNLPTSDRLHFSPILSRSQSNAFPFKGTRRRAFYDAMMLELEWVLKKFQRQDNSLEELSSARKVWVWQNSYEPNVKLREMAGKLEAIYRANNVAEEFENLLTWTDSKDMGTKAATKAAALAAATGPDQIEAFIDRGLAFLGSEEKASTRLNGVAWELGKLAEGNAVVQDFIAQSLQGPTVSVKSDFGATAATNWAAQIRKGDKPNRGHEIISSLLATCGSDEQRANLLMRVYGRVPMVQELGRFTPEEINLFRSKKDMFASTPYNPAFIGALAVSLDHDWPGLKHLLEEAIGSVRASDLKWVMKSLVDGIYWAVRESDRANIPQGLNEWVMDQVNRVPDTETIWSHIEWHLEEIFSRIGRVPLKWLPGALRVRQESERRSKEADQAKARAVGSHSRISRFVQKVREDLAGRDEDLQHVRQIFEFLDDDGTIGYYLPQILVDIDPEGDAVVKSAIEIARKAGEEERLMEIARIGGAYGVGSAPWRSIAKATISAGLAKNMDVRSSIIPSLSAEGMQFWSAAIGEVSPEFTAAVESAEALLEKEKDDDLRVFWQWRLDCAQRDLKFQLDMAKEARGE